MAKINRFNGNLVPFASASLGTERTLFGEATQANDITSQFTAGFLRGWGIVGPSDQPTLQDFNAVSYTHGQILSYLHQMGVAEYNAAQEYHIGSISQTGGIVYISLQNNNTGNTPASTPLFWRDISSIPLRTVKVQTFSASGTYTPSAGMQFATVRQVGGGGGGGGSTGGAGGSSAAGGGQSGGYNEKTFTAAQIGASRAVTIGAPGPAGSGGGNGGNGGGTSFGSLLTCAGGSGGFTGANAIALGLNGALSGSLGSATGGDINIPGEAGGAGIVFGGVSGGYSGFGGGNPFSGRSQQAGPISGGANPPGPGGGGSGGTATTISTPGGAGGPGFMVIIEYCSQ